MISLNYKDGRALHEQIENGLRELMVCGVLSVDEQLPSVRELAVSLTVNPNTVQRAYKQLESEGYIYSIKGKGNFVSDISAVKDNARTQELYATLTSILKELMYLGEDKSVAEKIINNVFVEKEESV